VSAPSPAQRATDAAMIELREVVFRYREGEFELRIATLLVEAGEQIAVIGPSGSGKTTLLHLAAGIVSPERGRVFVDGAEIPLLSEADRRRFRITRLGLVFQEFALLEHLSVIDNVLLPYRITPELKLDDEVRQRADELLRDVKLADEAQRVVTRLSQGERQRVAVCRALVTEPKLLLADEPTGNLDPANKFRVVDILREYAEAHSATLVTVTHDHDLLSRFSRVIDFKAFHSPNASSKEGSEARR
jgi:putative ABC transport system ATP-binding protein